MSQQTEQVTVNNYGQDTRSFRNSSAGGTRNSTGSRNSTSESQRDLSSEGESVAREVSRSNVAMTISFSIPILSKAPVNPNSTPC